MSVILAKENIQEEVMMRDIYCRTLMDLAEADRRVVVLDSDLMKSMGMIPFQKAYPDRTFNCGVQEADMIGIAAGLAATGKVPYAHSFATFASRRCYDQVFLSAAYARLNVRVIGSDPGVTAAYNGGTHMPFEDIGIMRNIPGATVLEPVDTAMLADVVSQLSMLEGVYYLRLLRRNAVKIYEAGSTFDIGRAVYLRDGSDVTVMATGIMVADALAAADLLAGEGISARVVNIFAIKPIDEEAVITCAKETGAIVTAENHNIIGGLGSAVAEVLAEHCPVSMGRIGCRDEFGEVGPVDYLKQRFKMTAGDIAEMVRRILKRK